MMTTNADNDAEHRLAVLTNWGLFGPFSLAFMASGFRADQFLIASAGYALLVAGFVSHLIINRIYRSEFRLGEIATAVTLFGVAILSFMASWAFAPGFSETDVLIGIVGLVVVIACFFAYLATRHGISGAFSMFHTHRES
ncbi:MAG: hypothetical protein F9K43_03720 [Bauldia sp.]|nr:MAG: hypothetical protein F9K43_03720 [Bauldia sp.]MBZ0228096.1 hypothetical protein [Bauldia sp.]